VTLTAPPRSSLLIIDDTPTNLEVLLGALEDEYDVRLARSGRQALALLRQDPLPALILLDVMMPGQDGYAVCAELKRDERTRSIPVVFITAKTDVDSELQALDAGAVDFIHKPIHIKVVRARVRLHLELEHRAQALARANTELALANQRLSELARRDGLTGLPNRRAADERLREEFVRVRRLGVPCAVLMLDIDHFKRVNDTHGHAVGDMVLRRVAELLRSAVRESDFVARFGGEEFLALLPATDLAQARGVGEKIRQLIATTTMAPVGTVTLSIGLAMAQGLEAHEREAVQHADAQLYAAKRAGRNRLCSE
jgi:diguanylate cyclase (GGDEF)-like protein